MIRYLRSPHCLSAILPIATLLVACNACPKQETPAKQESTAAPAPANSVVAVASSTAPQAAPSVAPSAATQTTRSGYSAEGLGALPENCVDPAVVLLAAPKKIYESDAFEWRHARQVALANPQFEVVRSLMPNSKPQAIAFSANEHRPTQGIALVGHCKTAETCIEFAAAYRAVVPAAKPTLFCGENPSIGARIQEGKAVLPNTGNISKVLPDAKDVQSQCVRLAACKAARDHALAGDETQGCIRKPGDYKPQCALKKSCGEVLACSKG